MVGRLGLGRGLCLGWVVEVKGLDSGMAGVGLGESRIWVEGGQGSNEDMRSV